MTGVCTSPGQLPGVYRAVTLSDPGRGRCAADRVAAVGWCCDGTVACDGAIGEVDLG